MFLNKAKNARGSYIWPTEEDFPKNSNNQITITWWERSVVRQTVIKIHGYTIDHCSCTILQNSSIHTCQSTYYIYYNPGQNLNYICQCEHSLHIWIPVNCTCFDWPKWGHWVSILVIITWRATAWSESLIIFKITHSQEKTQW